MPQVCPEDQIPQRLLKSVEGESKPSIQKIRGTHTHGRPFRVLLLSTSGCRHTHERQPIHTLKAKHCTTLTRKFAGPNADKSNLSESCSTQPALARTGKVRQHLPATRAHGRIYGQLTGLPVYSNRDRCGDQLPPRINPSRKSPVINHFYAVAATLLQPDAPANRTSRRSPWNSRSRNRLRPGPSP